MSHIKPWCLQEGNNVTCCWLFDVNCWCISPRHHAYTACCPDKITTTTCPSENVFVPRTRGRHRNLTDVFHPHPRIAAQPLRISDMWTRGNLIREAHQEFQWILAFRAVAVDGQSTCSDNFRNDSAPPVSFDRLGVYCLPASLESG